MLRRGAIIVSLTLSVLAGSAVPAAADDWWGSTDCSQNNHPGCDLGVGKRGEREAAPPPRRDGAPQQGGEPKEEPKSSNPDWNRAKCSYKRSDYKPSSVAQAAFEAPPGVPSVQPALFHSGHLPSVRPAVEGESGKDGAWYVYKCDGNSVRDAFYRPPVWIPDGEGDGSQVSPAQLAQQARDQLRLPAPGIKASPAQEQLVKLPTWLWMERGDWQKVSATASVPGASVTAVARPTSVDWSMGDGHSVTCKGPGTPYSSKKAASRASEPKRSSPDCGYTYRSSSAGKEDDAYPVSATVHWEVTWSGAGQSGTVPDLTTTSSAAFRVAESQAVNRGG